MIIMGVERPLADMKANFEQAIEAEYLEADLGAEVHAYAAVLDHWVNKTPLDATGVEGLADWLNEDRKTPDAATLKAARRALQRLQTEDSELRELWEETDEYDTWRREVKELRERLGS